MEGTSCLSGLIISCFPSLSLSPCDKTSSSRLRSLLYPALPIPDAVLSIDILPELHNTLSWAIISMDPKTMNIKRSSKLSLATRHLLVKINISARLSYRGSAPSNAASCRLPPRTLIGGKYLLPRRKRSFQSAYSLPLPLFP